MTTKELGNEIRDRVDQLQEKLSTHDLDGALFVQKVDVYYLSGTDQDAHLWIPAQGPPLLMVRRSIERAKKDAGMDNIVNLPGFSGLPGLLKQAAGSLPGRMGLEMDVLPVTQYRLYRRLFPDTEMVDISSIIRVLRMVKSTYEISAISKAAEMADRMLEHVPTILRHVETETDLALQLEAFYRSLGHPGIVRTRAFNMECFYGHVLAGKNAAVLGASPGPMGGTGTGPFYSQGAGSCRILPHEPVLVDYTSSADGYVSDQTRTFSLGRLPEHLARAHQVMLEIQDEITRNAGPGVRAGDLYARALDVVQDANLENGFMGYPDPVPFVAHGIGLELDEWPIIGQNSETILQEGMVFALGPKCILPDEGAVGVENVFVVTSDGVKKLNRFPDTVCFC